MTLADVHPDAFYDAKAVAEIFGKRQEDGSVKPLSVDTVYSMASRGVIRATRLGVRLMRFKGSDILEAAKERAA